MIVQKDFDLAFNSLPKIHRKQREKLLAHIDYCVEKSPWYQDHLAGQTIPDGSLWDILDALPLTDKRDLAENNELFLAVPPEAVSDIVVSSGTTGKPVKICYSEHDLLRLAYNEEKAFLGCGMTRADRVLLTCTIDRCFVAGLAYYLGTREIGAATIRNGHANLAGHLDIIQRLEPTFIVGVPTFLRKLALYLQRRGIDPATTRASKLICIGEPIRDRTMSLTKVGADLEKLWDARVFSTYASTETVTTFCECSAQAGGHLHPDLAIVEIIDDNGRRLPPGEEGEVVITPLAVEGMPLLRFRTGDLGFLLADPCPCGKTSPRLSPVLGRKKHMLKVKGTTVYPQAVFDLLAALEGIQEYMITVSSGDDLSDHLEVAVSVDASGPSEDELLEMLQARLRVKPSLVIENEAVLRARIYLPELRKPKRFFDRRMAV